MSPTNDWETTSQVQCGQTLEKLKYLPLWNLNSAHSAQALLQTSGLRTEAQTSWQLGSNHCIPVDGSESQQVPSEAYYAELREVLLAMREEAAANAEW